MEEREKIYVVVAENDRNEYYLEQSFYSKSKAYNYAEELRKVDPFSKYTLRVRPVYLED